MIAAWLLGGALCMAAGDDGAKPAGPDRAAYDAAVAAAGRDADAQVDLALWCEARGMAAEKAKHLARAVLLDPENPRARGLLGQVKRDGRWLRASDAARGVEESAERKALMAEYFDRRSKTDDDADGQYKLALWCEEKGLKEPMVAHLHRTLQLDPGREGAWRRLGFKKVGKRWVTPEIEAALKAEQEIQAKADRAWKPRLEKLRDALADKDAAKQAEAREALASISDPRAVPALFQVFAKGGAEPRQAVAVDVLSRIDGPGASLALATLAVYSPHAPIRSDASALLQRRDPREFAGFLALQIRDEVKYKVKPVDGPGSQGELLVESKDANIRRIYRPLQSPAVQPGDRVETDANGTVIVTRPVGTPIVGSPLSARALTAMALGLPASSFSAVPRDGLIADPFGVTDLPMVSWERGYTDAMLPWTYMLDRPAVASAALQKAGVPAGLSDTVVGRIQESNSFARSAAAAFGILSFNNAAANQLTIRPVLQDAVQFPLEQMRAQAQTSALVAREHLASDVANIEAYNAPVRDANERAIAVLKAVSGEDLGKDRVKWMDWVVDLQGYGQPLRAPSVPPADVVEEVPIAYQPQTVPVPTTEVTGFRMGPSCFAGGTLVRTLQGDRPIETIRPGDLVLSQDVTTGKLDFKPVVEALHNPPNSTYAVDLGKEVVHPTGIHRFWKAGEGWVMARDLRPGDRLRTAGGAVEVASVAKEEARPVFNLLLAGGDSYHVGSIGLLAHDNGLVEPVAAPFDAVPPDAKLAAATNP